MKELEHLTISELQGLKKELQKRGFKIKEQKTLTLNINKFENKINAIVEDLIEGVK